MRRAAARPTVEVTGHRDAHRSGQSLIGYVGELLDTKRATPADDLLSALVGVHDADGDRLSQEELVSVAITLLLAGYETTVSLLGNGTVLLLTSSDQVRLLRADPARVPAAVDELVRLAGPPTSPLPLHPGRGHPRRGHDPAGATIQVAYAAANRDPRRFPDPTQLDVTRTDNKHLGFGHGIHYCLGAPLARLEATVAFAALLARFPDLTWPYLRAKSGACSGRGPNAISRARTLLGAGTCLARKISARGAPDRLP